MAARSRRGIAPRRKRVWVRDQGTDTLTGTSPIAHDLMATWAISGGPALIGCTVVRVRLTVAVARTAGASTVPNVTHGVIVAPASMESLDLDPTAAASGLNLDWMLWEKAYLVERPGVAAAALLTASWTYDVKSMRKLDELGDTLWLVAGGFLTDTYAYSWGASALVLLP